MKDLKEFFIRAAKVLLHMAMDEAMRKGLPAIYERLDADLPQVLSVPSAGPIVVESVVGQAIAAVTGKRATETQIKAVVGLYDPIKGAIRNVKRNQR